MATPITICFGVCCVLLIAFLKPACCILGDDEFEGSRTLVLEHAFDGGSEPEYVKRGTLVIQSLKRNKAQFTQAASLSSEDINTLKSLAQNGGFYRIRVPVKSNTEGQMMYVSSATKACGIVESSLKDFITINFDQTGEVLGISIRPSIGSCSGMDVPEGNLTSWYTNVEVSTTTAGPMPDTQTYIEKMKRDDMEKMKNQEGDNRSFLGKYWMYIVPVVIMMIVMSSADPQAQGGGGGGR